MKTAIENAVAKVLGHFNKVNGFISEHHLDAEEIRIIFVTSNGGFFQVESLISTPIEEIDIEDILDLDVKELLQLIDAVKARIYYSAYNEEFKCNMIDWSKFDSIEL